MLVIAPRASEPIKVAPAASIVVEPARSKAVIVEPPAWLTVEAPQRSAWDEKGWRSERQRRKTIYEGFYLVRDRRQHFMLKFAGRIIQTSHGIEVYVADPPAEIKKHPKGPCFTAADLPWYRMHWHRPARNVDDAILYVEKILDEVINNHKR